MTLLDNKMTECLFNIAQFLNNFNTSNKINPDVKTALQAPLTLYHQQKDSYQKILADNVSTDPIATVQGLAFMQSSLKFVKLNALLNQPEVPGKVSELNDSLTNWIGAEDPAVVVTENPDSDNTGNTDDTPDDNNNGNG